MKLYEYRLIKGFEDFFNAKCSELAQEGFAPCSNLILTNSHFIQQWRKEIPQEKPKNPDQEKVQLTVLVLIGSTLYFQSNTGQALHTVKGVDKSWAAIYAKMIDLKFVVV